MLHLESIRKKYQTGSLVQTALDGVTLDLRDTEFVAILGPSGSGKTTLLNIIGGLDCYDSGELIIDGISTKSYRDRDWDSYRNHAVGFVFQSYNLIPHQTILSNVELALTISGVRRAERRKRAVAALEQVGLGDQLHKRPNQLSGGQMQRVAIARALVNDPKILLADEPTGALDTETSISVMNLLKEVAKDRLVVMVTHNPELAAAYATRTVTLRDGKITSDSMPAAETQPAAAVQKRMGKASMSFFTSLSLSFHNLRTKKGRTFLTAFAGSIGIIGIALILSLSTGVNDYIAKIQKDTMTSYPITIEAESLDLSGMFSAVTPRKQTAADHELDGVYSNGTRLEQQANAASSYRENNLTAFKQYLDDPDSEIRNYIGENGIIYSYDVAFQVYTHDGSGTLVNTDGSTLAVSQNAAYRMMSQTGTASSENFSELIPDADGASVSAAVRDHYYLLYGAWPEAYDEVVLIVDQNNEISAKTLYELGILPSAEYKELMQKVDSGETISVPQSHWDYASLCAQELRLLPTCDTYQDRGDGTFSQVTADDPAALETLLRDKGLTLRITGVIRRQDNTGASQTAPVGYLRALTNYLIGHAEDSAVVAAQKADQTRSVLNGLRFSPQSDAEKAEDARLYISRLGISEKAKLFQTLTSASTPAGSQTASESELAAMLDAYLENPDEAVLLKYYAASVTPGSYDSNLKRFGAVSLDAPSSISLYADSFNDKNAISAAIEHYNQTASETDQITYTDYVALLTSSVEKIVNVISYVLIAFVALSLVVSSIMIGIITYISVLERTKEIGILRAVGASKRNISQVFNAETFIIGLLSGAIGVGVSLLLLIPGNALIHTLTGTADVNAVLSVRNAAILTALSVVLTLIGGLIPARKAAKKDPVIALRSE